MTGKNFAINAAPGLSREWRREPLGAIKKVANKTPHPASADGKDIEKNCNSRLKRISRKTSTEAANNDFFTELLKLEGLDSDSLLALSSPVDADKTALQGFKGFNVFKTADEVHGDESNDLTVDARGILVPQG